MKLINKLPEPVALNNFRNGGGTWNDFSLNKGKREVKNQLLLEQNNLCAYCTASINFNSMKVEHWCSQENCISNRDLDYSNLLAVCSGCFNHGEYEHCDTSKKAFLIELSPVVKHHIDVISYAKASGKIESVHPDHQIEIDSILNLNIPPLKRIRKNMLNEFKIGLSKKYKGKKANYQKELEKFQNARIPFSMIVIKYLEDKIN